MSCDLCAKNSMEKLLCKDCAEMIHRLATVEQRTRNRERCAAERLAKG